MMKVIGFSHSWWYNEPVEDLISWLHNLATKPLPGGVSAAALASAMGAALIAKAARISLQRQEMSEGDYATCKAVLTLADQQQQVLLSLFEADERAYRAVLDSYARNDNAQAERAEWYEATEVPIRVAEACHSLLRQLPELVELCWPAVLPDLQVGRWLLETGVRAGLSAAESNLKVWDNTSQASALRLRIDAL